MDNLRKPQRSHKRAPLDGIIRPRQNTSRNAGSINFRTTDAQVPQRPLDDFRRSDGFHSTPRSTIEQPALADRPRHPFTPGVTPMPGAKRAQKKRSWKRYALRGGLGVFIVVALVSGFLGWKVFRNTGKIFQGSVFGLFDSTKLKGEDTGRVNILLTGTSEDDPGHPGALLTDSIMIISLDTVNHSAFLMSIPDRKSVV